MLDLSNPRDVKILELVLCDVLKQAKNNITIPEEDYYFYDDIDKYMDSLRVVENTDLNRICKEHSEMSYKISKMERDFRNENDKLCNDLKNKDKYYKSIIRIKTNKIKKLEAELDKYKQLSKNNEVDSNEELERLMYENKGLRQEIKELKESLTR